MEARPSAGTRRRRIVASLAPSLAMAAALAAPGAASAETASVTLGFERHAGRRRAAAPRATVALGTLRAGARRVRFTGRLSRSRALALGIYRLVVTARDRAGNRSLPVRAAFRLIAPRRR